MEIDAEKLFNNAISDGILAGVVKALTGYNNPLDKLIESAIDKRSGEFRELLDGAISSAVNNPRFRDEITAAVHKNLARTLIQRFGGEVEKQVNALKSDPMTRARITLAIEEIVKSK